MKRDLMSSGFFRFFSRIAELMLLNFLFILCCLPIVTAGASLSALYSVSLKLIRHQDSYIVRDFFRAFRQNLKQGILIHLLFCAAASIIITDLVFLWNIMEQSELYKGVFFVMVVIALFLFCASMYVYPLLAQFKNTLKGYFRNAAILSIKHLRYTIMFFLIAIAPFFPAMLISGALEWMILIYLLFGFSGTVYIQSLSFATIFDTYIEDETDASQE